MQPRSALRPVSRSIPTPPEISEPLEVLVRSPKAQPYMQFGFVWELPRVGREQADLPRATSWYTRQLMVLSVKYVVVVQLLSCVNSLRPHGLQNARLLSFTISQSLLKLMSNELVMLTISSFAAPFSFWLQSFIHQGLSQWLRSLHQVAKVLEF